MVEGLGVEKLLPLFQKEIDALPYIITSAVPLITMGIRILKENGVTNVIERKELLLQVLRKIAAGNDGLHGTADDIIPIAVMDQLAIMLETHLAADMITAIQGNELMNKTTDKAKGCFSCLRG